MIVSIRHKGLLTCYETGNSSGLPATYSQDRSHLDQLDAISSTEDIRQMGSGIHKLTGDLNQFWSITVSPNFRIIFRFEDGDVYDVDYVEPGYHPRVGSKALRSIREHFAVLN
ncbi:type II toxin-antitoxin system RelE/ParE family toxin [Dyadobacter sp. CY323]|uniref:type II toxin-antitoxin system RelE/ParE family toxin n=1 Tax=Dyadobacter sp. CY323 TaxID=2907302 RepID=UPI001F383F82|nr:type II toxin-antitoxin system RelE/ParE family toxin [Dyadobacter sp. CY323]MCE6989403.1 type II toxin-antitoxin system RelE/ParE family toxin [Dyadobacter sp. CY323]